jgi:5-methylcytosine-specific restriction endonuclease McrA
VRRYRARHPERATAQRDGRRRKAPFGPEAIAYREFIQGDPCAYCGGPADSTDHILPVALGGLSTADNLTAACTICNSRKRDRTLLDFLLEDLIRRRRLGEIAA